MPPTPWNPVLDAKAAAQARDAIDAIAARLREEHEEHDKGADQDPTLAGGRAGLALLFAYLARSRPDAAAWELAERHLETAIEAVSSRTLDPGLYGGFVGIAWAVEHLERMRLDDPDEDPNEDIDEALLGALDMAPWKRDYDLISGLVGFGVYALERLPRGSAAGCLERVVERLDELAERSTDGITWWTSPDLLLPETRLQFPNGYYNVGLAHGVPGVIALLGDVCAANIAREKAEPLLEGAVSWLLKQRLPAGRDPSCFPYQHVPGLAPQGARLAWCYGDPGIAASLLVAARAVGRSDWERVALDVARRAAARPLESSGVNDAGICHGSAGLGLIFHRLFAATGDEVLREAARFWYQKTLDLRRPGEGFGGYVAWTVLEGGKMGWGEPAGFLAGSAGVALALLAATSNVEPAWDRTLLVSGA